MSAATVDPRSLILNLLLAAGGKPITARAAVTSGALFGIRENNVRVALARLSNAGLLEGAGRGAYVLGPNATRLAADVAAWRTAERLVRDWNGDWIAVHVGGHGRADRVALRARERAFALVGIRELDRGLYVRPDNMSGGVGAVRDRLHKLGVDSKTSVFVARAFDPDRERVARSLWDGKKLSKGYRDGRHHLETWLARAEELDPEAAARESFLIGHAAIRQLVFDPLLPAPLVEVEERRAFARAVREYDRVGRAIWRRLKWMHSNADRMASAS